MTRKKPTNRIVEIKPEFESILVCNDKKLCPFIQILIQEPENIDSQNLGTLVGIFEVTDSSEDSSYIVNYLISIIKKEYFSKPKRGPIESLEASLHKANLALSSLAEHENIDWLGNLNALIAVTEKNGLHFSQAGNASAFLLRSRILTDISDGLSSLDREPNPLKTFVNVSSGRMEADDKLIITTSDIFDIFSLEEIKKSALRFSKNEFVQFLRTALGSELEKVAVLVVDFSAKEPALKKTPLKKISAQPLNAFSNDAFKYPAPKKDIHLATLENQLQEEIQKSQAEFIDKKTGHIYIKEDTYPPADYAEEPTAPYMEQATVLLQATGHFLRKKATRSQEKLGTIARRGKHQLQKYATRGKLSVTSSAQPERGPVIASFLRKGTLPLSRLTLSAKDKAHLLARGKKIAQVGQVGLTKITPSLRKIRSIVLRMDYQQRLYGLLVLILIFIVPFFVAQFLNERAAQKKAAAVPAAVEITALPLAEDKNVTRVQSPASVASAVDISTILQMNDRLYIITSTEIIDVTKNIPFALPQNFTAPTQAQGMNDLNLIFLTNADKQVLSFSPTSGKFQENAITIPETANIAAMGTYLTYLYLADSRNNQIYRYPRAEGGFAEKTDWLKEEVSLTHILDFSINENVFVIQGDTLTKLFRGKKEPFTIETTATPLKMTSLSIESESGNLLLLDRANARAVYLTKDGQIMKQYYHPELQQAVHIILDEKNNLFYFSTETELKTIPLS